MVAKDLALAERTSPPKHALWLDLRSTDDDQLRGGGLRIENARGVIIQITKVLEVAGALNIST